MAGQVTFRSSILVFLIAMTACVVASAIPRRMKVTPLRDYLEDSSNPEDAYGFVGGYPLRQTRRGLDSLSGATFGESKRFAPREVNAAMLRPSLDDIERSMDHYGKRNIDEIDRTAFDSFLKRNFDEIDRVGWSGFVKRLDNYLRDRQLR